MKKLLLLIPILLLTGCLGEVGKGYITKTCTKEEKINGLNVSTNIKIKSKSGTPETITIIETYDENLDIKSITNSKKSEQNYYIKEKGITLEMNNNEYIYTINAQEINDEIKEKFNIKEDQHKQVKYYEENGFTCK